MGNWLWVGDSPEEAARHLAPAVSYIHVKAAEPHHEQFRAVPPDEAPAAGWRCSIICPPTPRAESNFR
jgi:sugar phosphate isomerase/epimerase